MNATIEAIMEALSVDAAYAHKVVALLDEYDASGFAPPNLPGEIATRQREKIQAAIWEAMLYWHFKNNGVVYCAGRVTKAGQNGPDLCIDLNGRRLWIEAVAATPTGVPSEWLAPISGVEFTARSLPHEEMLLRYTSVLADKKTQLTERIAKGIIGPDDAYVIAVNGCMLSFWRDGHSHGITGWPFIVEAVLPIGPLAVPFDRNENRVGEAANTLRYSLTKPNKACVPLDNFLNDEWRRVSAAVWCGQRDHLSGRVDLVVVHNPRALVPIPKGSLGNDPRYEYVAEDDGAGGYILQRPTTG